MGKTRRAVVTTAAKVAVTAPAVGVLLSASTVPAGAAVGAIYASEAGILDDFTFGNVQEDIDALAQHTNFLPWNGGVSQDDHV